MARGDGRLERYMPQEMPPVADSAFYAHRPAVVRDGHETSQPFRVFPCALICAKRRMSVSKSWSRFEPSHFVGILRALGNLISVDLQPVSTAA